VNIRDWVPSSQLWLKEDVVAFTKSTEVRGNAAGKVGGRIAVAMDRRPADEVIDNWLGKEGAQASEGLRPFCPRSAHRRLELLDDLGRDAATGRDGNLVGLRPGSQRGDVIVAHAGGRDTRVASPAFTAHGARRADEGV
jgi:hypothetical protein